MTTYVLRDGQLVDKSLANDLYPTGPATYIIRDTIDGTWHPASGKIFDSKHRFRAETKAYGCQEIGDQKDYGKTRSFTPKLDKRQRIDDIRRTVYELRNGVR